MKKRIAAILCLVLLSAALAVYFYVTDYYRADQRALSALASDAFVSVSETDYGYFFDGPASGKTLVFYPGAKVEERAYAPFLRLLAEEGMDVCLVRMPLRLAFLDMDAAAEIMEETDSEVWYLGGHSLGGAAAAIYASGHPEKISGLILCAAYPTRQLGEDLTELILYGSEDRVLNMEKLEEGRAYAPERSREYCIEGGNHAFFGDYGLQKGDGEALLTPEEQQEEAVRVIRETFP
jgi:pimeloyl-ACP methyl ester carboxylesterase